MSAQRLFKLSEAVALALHAGVILAERSDELISTKQLAEGLQASESHLSKVMQRLARAGLVSSTRGPGGGFRLDRAAKDVSLLDIYEAIEGKLHVVGCLFDRPVCDGHFCILGNLIYRLETEAFEYLKSHTLSDVGNRRKKSSC